MANRQTGIEFGVAAATVIGVALLLVLPFSLLAGVGFDLIKLGGDWPESDPSDIIGDTRFWAALGRGFLFGVAGASLQVVLGLFAALAVWKRFVGRAAAVVLLMLPYAIPMVVIAATTRLTLDGQYGQFARLLQDVGLIAVGVGPLNSPEHAFATLVIIGGWSFFPFVLIAVLAKLSTIPEPTTEAMRLDDAGPVSDLFWVILPELWRVLALVFFLRFLWMFNKFDAVWLFTRGGPLDRTTTVPVVTFREAFIRWRVEHAAVQLIVSIVAVLCAAGIAIAAVRLGCAVFRRHRSVASSTRSTWFWPPFTWIHTVSDRIARTLFRFRRIALAGAVAAVLIPLGLVVRAAFADPASLFAGNEIGGWRFSTENVVRLVGEAGFLRSLANSVLVATISAGVSVFIAVHVVWAGTLLGRRWSLGLSASALAIYGLPGVAIVIPLFITARSLGLTGTSGGLAAALVFLTLPFNVWYLLTVRRESAQCALLDDAARVDGANSVRRHWEIVTPSIFGPVCGCFVFSWIISYSDFLFASIWMPDLHRSTFSVWAAAQIERSSVDWGPLAAACLIGTVPPLLLFSSLAAVGLRRVHAVLSAADSREAA